MTFNGKVLPIDCSLEDDFFRKWIEYLTPKHGLTKTQILVLSELLKERYFLSQKITDEALLDEISMNVDTKRRVKERCNIKESHFQVLMSILKQKGVIVNNRINPQYIPPVSGNDFKLMLWFRFKDAKEDSQNSNK